MIRRLALLVALMLLAMASGVAMLRRLFVWTAADEAALAEEERWFREYAAGDVDWNDTGEVVA